MKAKQKKSITGAVIAAVIPVVILSAMAAGCLLFGKILKMRVIPFLFALLYLAIAIGILFALRQRIKEIKGGEEDEASQY